MESLCKGLSGMDAARAPMGQGRPFGASPWSNDGAKGGWRRSRQTRMSGVLSLWLLSLCTSKEKVTRHKGEKHGTETNRSRVALRCLKSKALFTLQASMSKVNLSSTLHKHLRNYGYRF